MKCGHLFNGIGGFALAASWMEWENAFHCEIDEYCNKVMNRHFPNSIQYGNIKEKDFSEWDGAIDLITGGFPCQPYSTAGKRLGKEDERHLWPEMLRAVREIRPGWVVGENVRGLTNWNGGMVFDEVQADLEAEGYEVLPFLLPAAGVGAPHQRDRIFFIAHSCRIRASDNDTGSVPNKYGNDSGEIQRKTFKSCGFAANGSFRAFADAYGHQRREGRLYTPEPEEAAGYLSPRNALGYRRDTWDNFPTSPAICGRDDGIPDRMDRLKALGNAIVPQVALQIFKAIDAYERESF